MNCKLYQQNLTKAMNLLAKEGYIFIGQTIVYGGSPMFKSLENVSKKQKIEFPVAEDTQMGFSLGLSLEEIKVCSIFPRVDFLICAINQLVNHLDKVEEMSKGEFKPGVIIRSQIGNTAPIYPGCQHCGDYYAGIKAMCKHIEVYRIENESEVMPLYRRALKRAKKGQSTVLIEVPTGAFGGKR